MRGRFSGSMIAVGVVVAAVALVSSVSINRAPAQTTVAAPQFKYDPSWPKPLPEGWVLGSVGSVCVDARDHVFVLTRGQPAPKERNLATPAPPVIEFDADGNVVNSWGDRDVMATTAHGCFIDKEGNFWTAGNNDGIVQKYTHDGSKMLLQIGTKGVMDSADSKSAAGAGLSRRAAICESSRPPGPAGTCRLSECSRSLSREAR